MCDYSLHNVATRPAQIEDKLITTRFSNSITRGFAAVGEPHVAVCLLPGTEIAFDKNVECQPLFDIGILPSKKIGQRLARFRQTNMDNAVITTMRWNSRMGRWYCLRAYARASAQPSCNCRPPHILQPRKRWRGQGFTTFAFEVSNATYFKTRSHRPRPVAFFKW